MRIQNAWFRGKCQRIRWTWSLLVHIQLWHVDFRFVPPLTWSTTHCNQEWNINWIFSSCRIWEADGVRASQTSDYNQQLSNHIHFFFENSSQKYFDKSAFEAKFRSKPSLSQLSGPCFDQAGQSTLRVACLIYWLPEDLVIP